MSDAEGDHVGPADPHVDPANGDVEHHDTHDAGHGGHGAAAQAEPLGPIDVRAWGYAVVGGGLGLLVAVVLYLAAS